MPENVGIPGIVLTRITARWGITCGIMGMNEAGARPTPHRAVSEWPSPGLVERVRSGVGLRGGGAVALRIRLAL